jgi:sugar lactone lactonase YvrE
MHRVSRLVIAIVVACTACSKAEKQPEKAAAPPPPLRITVSDSFNAPESVLYDPQADIYLVSNINGTPLAKDNNGFISRVNPDSGKVVQLKWIAGGANGVTLNAPKGMGIVGDTLFVADIDVVRMFNRTTGAPMGQRVVRGATFLNDIAVGRDSTVYVTDSGLKPGPNNGFSDSGTDALYRFARGGLAVAVIRGKNLGRPNGITVDTSGVTVVTFGSGEVYRVDAKGKRTDLPKPPKGQLDGVEKLPDGSLILSSWEGAAVYKLTGGAYTTVVDSVTSPADIGYDPKRGVVMIPVMMKNLIEIREIK